MKVSCELHAPAALPPGKAFPVPIGQEAGGGGVPEPVWRYWRRQYIPSLSTPGTEPSRPARMN